MGGGYFRVKVYEEDAKIFKYLERHHGLNSEDIIADLLAIRLDDYLSEVGLSVKDVKKQLMEESE